MLTLYFVIESTTLLKRTAVNSSTDKAWPITQVLPGDSSRAILHNGTRLVFHHVEQYRKSAGFDIEKVIGLSGWDDPSSNVLEVLKRINLGAKHLQHGWLSNSTRTYLTRSDPGSDLMITRNNQAVVRFTAANNAIMHPAKERFHCSQLGRGQPWALGLCQTPRSTFLESLLTDSLTDPLSYTHLKLDKSDCGRNYVEDMMIGAVSYNSAR